MDPIAARVCDAALTCVERWGITKTTLEDVAREAGVGRATIYRTFKGGKNEVLVAVLRRELQRFVERVEAAIAGLDDLEDVVVAGVVAASRQLADHRALHFVLAHEPDVVLPHVAFDRMGFLYDLVATWADPHLARFLPDPDQRGRAAEWLARVVLTYVLNPADGVDLTEADAARHLVRTFVLPGLLTGSRTPQET